MAPPGRVEGRQQYSRPLKRRSSCAVQSRLLFLDSVFAGRQCRGVDDSILGTCFKTDVLLA